MKEIKVFQQNNFWYSEIANLNGSKNGLNQIPNTFQFVGVSVSAVVDQARNALNIMKGKK
jgi:hypothetical protein